MERRGRPRFLDRDYSTGLRARPSRGGARLQPGYTYALPHARARLQPRFRRIGVHADDVAALVLRAVHRRIRAFEQAGGRVVEAALRDADAEGDAQAVDARPRRVRLEGVLHA